MLPVIWGRYTFVICAIPSICNFVYVNIVSYRRVKFYMKNVSLGYIVVVYIKITIQVRRNDKYVIFLIDVYIITFLTADSKLCFDIMFASIK